MAFFPEKGYLGIYLAYKFNKKDVDAPKFIKILTVAWLSHFLFSRNNIETLKSLL